MKPTKIIPLAIASLMLAAVSCGKDAQSPKDTPSRVLERWDGANDPVLMSLGARGFEMNFADLALKARLETKPWSDSYWPSKEGGLAARWNAADSNAFTYVSPTREQVASYTREQLVALSPAEKYDILMGRYDYPMVRSERARTSPNDPHWAGLCHGWAPAALHYKEPTAVTLKNADGVSVPFGSSDVKALLTYYQGQVARTSTRFLASRCNIDLAKNPDSAQLRECRDTNAGAFHVVLANLLARGEGFIADVTRDLEVWNQPVYAFSTQVIREQAPSAGAAPGTDREVVVQTTIRYGMEIEANWEPLGLNQSSASRTYVYRLELDLTGKIIGGDWLTDDRPDFLWAESKAEFVGYFGALGELYKAATVEPLPTPTPTAVPTVVPTVAPTVVPTVAPTVVPTVEPTATPVPTPTVVPNVVPVPTPSEPSNGPSVCPTPYTRKRIPDTKVRYCVNEGQVLGPMSEEVKGLCLSGAFEDCNDATWSESTFLAVRGTKRCMPGTSFDEKTGYCREGTIGTRNPTVFGPFSQEIMDGCIAARSEEKCTTNRLNRAFVRRILGR